MILLPNIYRLAKVMMEYYRNEGFDDEIKIKGYKWKATKDYWIKHLNDVRELLRKKRKLYFEFLRENNTFRGQWKFVNKKQYNEVLKREYSDVGTRTDTYNEKLDDGKEKWNIELPHIEEVPLLEN